MGSEDSGTAGCSAAPRGLRVFGVHCGRESGHEDGGTVGSAQLVGRERGRKDGGVAKAVTHENTCQLRNSDSAGFGFHG